MATPSPTRTSTRHRLPALPRHPLSTCARAVFAVVPLLAASTAFAAGADGIWTLRERFCVVVDGQRQCGPGREQLMFLAGVAYYRSDASEEFSEMGTVATPGRRVVVSVDREGFARLIEARTGVDVRDYLESFTMVFRGVLRGERIVNGQIRARGRLDVEGDVHTLRASGSFTARREGDAVLDPPDDELEELRGGRSRGDGAGSIAGLISGLASR